MRFSELRAQEVCRQLWNWGGHLSRVRIIHGDSPQKRVLKLSIQGGGGELLCVDVQVGVRDLREDVQTSEQRGLQKPSTFPGLCRKIIWVFGAWPSGALERSLRHRIQG